MDTLRIGIIGVGHMAKKYHIPSLERLDGVEIVASCDLRADRLLPETRQYTEMREMLAKESLDAVYVLTPPGAHLEPVCLALDHGCHVFCEMPPALEPLEAAQMATFAHESGRSLMFGVNRHFAPTYQRVRKITREQPPKMTVLTKCRHGLHDLPATFLDSLETRYAQRHNMDGTPMFLGITQFLEVAEWLNGPILDCEAKSRPPRVGMSTMTSTAAHLLHENGSRSMVTYDEFGDKAYEHVTVHSSASTYIVRGSIMQPNELLVWTEQGQSIYPAPNDPQTRGGFFKQTQHFINSLRDEKTLCPDSEQLSRLVHLARIVDGSAWWQYSPAEAAG